MSPSATLTVVVLPAPFGPSRPNDVAVLDAQVDAPQDVDAASAEARVDCLADGRRGAAWRPERSDDTCSRVILTQTRMLRRIRDGSRGCAPASRERDDRGSPCPMPVSV